MEERKFRFFTPEEKSKELDQIMIEVKKQVEQYRAAKKAGTLRKISDRDKNYLVSV